MSPRITDPAGNPGFTLMELMIAMALGTILIGFFLKLYLDSHKTFIAQEEMADLTLNSRYGINRLGDELRQAGATLPGTLADVVLITPKAWGDSVVILRNSSGAYDTLSQAQAATDDSIWVSNAAPFKHARAVVFDLPGAPLILPTVTFSLWDTTTHPGKIKLAASLGVAVAAGLPVMALDTISFYLRDSVLYQKDSVESALAEHIGVFQVDGYKDDGSAAATWADMVYTKINVTAFTSSAYPGARIERPVSMLVKFRNK